MNALVKKEIRLLSPSFGIALLLALSVWLIPGEPANAPFLSGWMLFLPLLFCPALVVMTALDSFGCEMSCGTFANLLAQPVSRSRIWWTKASLLAAALLTVLGVWCLSFLLHVPTQFFAHDKDAQEMFTTAVMLVVTAYSGGLLSVLLFRQVGAAFWFTLLVPAALAMLTVYLTEKFSQETHTERNLVIVLVAYSVAGFFGAQRMFLQAQDVQWTGGTIALPNWLRLPQGFVPSWLMPGRRPWAALFAKEFQLHQSQFVIAGVLVLLHLGVIATRKFGDFKDSPTIEFVLGQFWVLWFAMPLLVGCAAVAEERKLGTLESQLCLPVRRRTQFRIKFSTAFLLSLSLSTVVPVLLEGTRIFPDVKILETSDLAKAFPHSTSVLVIAKVLSFVHILLPLLIPMGIAAVTAIVSFYASTLSRNTLQALAPAVLGIVVCWMLLMGARQIEEVVGYPLWRGWLIYLIGVPVMTLILLALMYWNFKRVLVGWNVWRRNALVFIASLAFVMGITAAVYHRTWELLTPLKPAHGAALLTSPKSVTMQSYGQAITVQLPGGKIWSDTFSPSAPDLIAMLSGNWKMKPMPGGRTLLEGTNWSSLATSFQGTIGVRKDGSLWASEKPRERSAEEPGKLVRVGDDDDWKAVVGHFPSAYLLKTNGTLWRMNGKVWNRKKGWPGIQAFAPHRLGTNSDWTEISRMEERTAFRKADGQTWIYPAVSTTQTNSMKLDDGIFIYRAENLDGMRSVASVWLRHGRIRNFQVGVRDDGMFVVNAALELLPGTHPQQSGFIKKAIQLGKESNWLAVAGQGETIVTLKADGSLWKWNFPDDPITEPESAAAVRLSEHSDWMAIAGEFGCVTSLAADGSLWFWQFDSRSFPPSDSGIPPLLCVSRKPQKIGNVFDTLRVP